MKPEKFFTVILLTFLTLLPMSAQIPLIRNFSPQDYGAGTQNWGFTESSGNYIFVANNEGLMVYGGTSWDIAPVPNHTNIHAVVCNRENTRYYVGAFEEFGYFENRAPLRDARYVSLASRLPEALRDFQWIWGVAEMPDGRVVFQSSDRLHVYYPATGRIRIFRLKGSVSDISLVGETLYISSDSGVYMMKGEKPEYIPGSRPVGDSHVVGAVPWKAGEVLFATRKRGFRILSGTSFRTSGAERLTEITAGIPLACLAGDFTRLAIGTVSNGILLVDGEQGRVGRYDRSNGLRNNSVLGLLLDRDRNVWAALENGLSYIVLDSPFRTIFNSTDNVGTGYASLPVGDALYLGTNQGLFRVERPAGDNPAKFNPVQVRGLSGQVWTLGEYGGLTLCGANDGGFLVRGEVAERLPGVGPTWGFREYPGRSDILIASQYSGFALLKREGGSYRRLTHIKGTTEATVNFEVDADGSLWYSHWLQGVYRLELNKELDRVLTTERFDSLNQLPTDEDNLIAKIGGKVYVSAKDGFLRYDPKTRKLEKVEWLDRLFPSNGLVWRLIETPEGNIWGFRPDDLVYAEKKGEGRYVARNLRYTSTVRSLQMNLGNISFLSPTRTIMNQNEGFYVVDTEMPVPESRKVSLDYARTIPESADEVGEYLYRSREDASDFVASHNQSSLYFAYSLSQYRDNSPVTFSTMIEGYDKDWTPYSRLGYREVINLPPGRYVMKVRALDSVSAEVTEESVEFRVRPAWYQTWWAVTLFIIFGGLAVYYLIEFAKREITGAIERRRIEEEQKRIEKLRAEELAEKNRTVSEDNERLNMEIKRKSGELVDTDLRNQQTSDALREVDESLKEILRTSDGNDSSEILSKVRRVVQTIRSHDLSESSRPSIQDNINIVFDDLLTKLVKSYPKLTRNDIRLCSYLKLNMSSKEIAALMNISERSVESNRYRLRKKLGMEPGRSFNEFFASFD